MQARSVLRRRTSIIRPGILPPPFALSVLCGKVGLFEINIVLSEEEKAEFYSQGEPYVEELAKAIQSSPSQFANRHEKDLSFD